MGTTLAGLIEGIPAETLATAAAALGVLALLLTAQTALAQPPPRVAGPRRLWAVVVAVLSPAPSSAPSDAASPPVSAAVSTSSGGWSSTVSDTM